MSVLEAVQVPRLLYTPDYRSSAGREVIDLAAMAGLELDPWEQLVLEHGLGEGDDGRWAAAEVGLCVPRQNGKNAVLEARELGALFLLDEELTIHSAHHFKTAKEHFLRLLQRIESTPDLDKRVAKVTRTHGEEGIELHGGRRILFFARTNSAGRGFTAPLIVFDEAMYLAEASMGSLMPTMSAMPNRQRWYVGSAVDQLIHPQGVVFARVRERALAGKDPRLAYFEWSLPAEQPELLDERTLDNPDAWAACNPGLGIRITPEAVADERRTLDARTFAVERLGVGDWPDTSPNPSSPIDLDTWAELVDENSRLCDPVCFAFDVTPDRAASTVAAAGRRPDGLLHVEIVRHERGTGWVVGELARLEQRWQPAVIACDAAGPAASLLHAAGDAGLTVTPVGGTDLARACGQLVDLVDNRQLRHLGSSELASALRGALKRQLGDSWAWSRRSSTVDISPLVAATIALRAAATAGWDPAEPVRIF